MADTPTFNPNPYANFDPSQYTNPYSQFYGRALPWPSSYAGTPTNALGQPIQPPPGMTLNSTPQQPQAAPAAAPQVGPMTGGQYGDWRGFVGGGAGASPQANQLAYNLGLGGLGGAGDVNPASAAGRAIQAQQQAPGAPSNPFANVPNIQGQNAPATEPRGGLSIADWQALSPGQRSAAMGPMSQYSAGLAMMPSGNNFVASGANPSGANPQASTALALMNAGISGYGQMAGQPSAAAPAPAAPPNNWQNSLSMLANPGHVTTPGATVPQAQGSTSLNPGVLQSFLSSWKPASSGPGSGFQQNFNTILRGLQGGQKGS